MVSMLKATLNPVVFVFQEIPLTFDVVCTDLFLHFTKENMKAEGFLLY